jgi:hypothetical protein
MNQRTGQFNAQLATTLTSLESSLNIDIFQLDVAGFFNDALSNPGKYGFTNVTQPALNGNTVAPNPDEYLFYDDIHPTRVGQRLLGDVASDLLDTHTWVSAQASASWDTAANWDPAEKPQARWIANLVHDSAADRSAVVTASSMVRKLRIGASPGTMTLKIASGATLNAQSLEIGTGGRIATELAAAGEQGKIQVAGAAALNGKLAISLASGFVALPGSSFQVLTFGSRTGDLSIENETGYEGLSFSKTFSSTDLLVTAGALGGDADLNGRVDVNDLGILASNWQLAGNWLAGDFDGSGVVEVNDLGILASHWQSAEMASLGFPAASAPEPSAALSFACACLIVTRASRPCRRGKNGSFC